MSALQDAGVVEAIRARHAQGKTIGGTSAGAAVMSQTMITRSAGRRGTPEANVPVTGQGLGLWPAVIVDQHFLKRKRQERLKSAVLTHPTLVGIGIEESTAIFVNGGEFEVVGAGPVTIYDARATTSPAPEAQTSGPGDLASPTQTLVSRTLTAGARFRLDGGTVVDPQPEPGATSGAAQAP